MWFTELKIKIHFLYQLQFKKFCNYSQIQINREDGVSLAKINLRTTKILCIKQKNCHLTISMDIYKYLFISYCKTK